MMLKVEMMRILSGRLGGDLAGAVNLRGVNERVNALTLICRDLLAESSLCYIDGVLHFFSGCCYVPVRKEVVLSVLGNLLVERGASPTDVRKMDDMPLSVVVDRSFGRSPDLISFGNGVLDLRSGSFRSGFSPETIVTEHLPYDYDPSAGHPLWDAFLSEVLPDESARLVLQEFFGMCYIDRRAMSVEKFAILIGEGANGKSVIRDVVARAIGPDNVKAYDAQQLTRTDLIPFLVGKRINFASDMKSSASFDSALKALSSGQEVEGRKIYSDPVKVLCPPICFSMNELPRFNDESPAFFRRVLLFRFGVVIPEERRDPSLAEKIWRSELPGVFNWIMEGRDRLLRQRGRFTKSVGMDGELEAVRRDSSAAFYPLRAKITGMGYAAVPQFDGQVPIRLPLRDIMEAMPNMTSNFIAREMRRLGYGSGRSRETFYWVYERK